MKWEHGWEHGEGAGKPDPKFPLRPALLPACGTRPGASSCSTSGDGGVGDEREGYEWVRAMCLG